MKLLFCLLLPVVLTTSAGAASLSDSELLANLKMLEKARSFRTRVEAFVYRHELARGIPIFCKVVTVTCDLQENHPEGLACRPIEYGVRFVGLEKLGVETVFEIQNCELELKNRMPCHIESVPNTDQLIATCGHRQFDL